MGLTIILLLLINTITSLFEDNLMYYGGGCAILNDTLYYLSGGKTDNNLNFKSNTINEDFIKINLKEGLTSTEKNTKWEFETTSNDNIMNGLYTSVLNSNDTIYLVGGKDVDESQTLRSYNVHTKSWDNKEGDIFFINLENNETMNYTPYFMSSIQNDINPNLFYFYGGLFNDTKNLNSSGSFTYYDFIKKGSIRNSNLNQPLYGATSFVKNGDLYLLGGYNFNQKQFMPLNQTLKFGFSATKWATIPLSGDIPIERIGHSSLLYKNELYLIGGTTDLYNYKVINNNFIYILNIDTWIWKKMELEGLEQVYTGCIKEYNNHMLIVLGYNQNGLKNKLQFFNLDNQRLVSSLPKKPTTPLSIGAIVGCSLAALIVTASIIGILIYKKRKLDKIKNTLKPPELLKQDIWADTSATKLVNNELTLMDLHLDDIDDDLKSRPNDM